MEDRTSCRALLLHGSGVAIAGAKGMEIGCCEAWGVCIIPPVTMLGKGGVGNGVGGGLMGGRGGYIGIT